MLRRYLDRKVSHTGVYPTQHRLLMELDSNPSCSQVELAEKFDVSAAAIAVSLKKLEKGGYITRLADESDNRINQVSITEKGKEVIRKSILIFRETDRCFFAGFTDEERAKMTGLLAAGFTDTFRHFYPDLEGAYSWWSYRFRAREKNAGWRIDYFIVSQRMQEQVREALIYDQIFGSDHCPVGLELAL